MERDLALLGAKFMTHPLEKEKQFLYHYFSSDIQINFVKYYLTFGNYFHFVEHTGFFCTLRWLKKLKKKLQIILDAYEKARLEGDFETIAEIEMGKFKL